MTPFWQDDHLTLYGGDCRAILAELPAESVHCVVTSPPYWGLRDYGVSDQLGLEATPEEYVANMVAVFREVRRVLRADGTLWLNLGDSYASSSTYNTTNTLHTENGWKQDGDHRPNAGVPSGLKPKDLVGIPWRVAFALQADGWVLRSDVVWSKPNPMPESVTDRPTKAHEMLFLFAKARWTGPVEPIYLSEPDSAWLAALIDGEGTIAVTPTSHGGFQVSVSIANTNRAILERVQAITNTGSVHSGGMGTNRPMYRWQATSAQATAILAKIEPRLIIKRRQAHVCIALQATHRRYGGAAKPEAISRKQAEFHALSRRLNQGEDVDVPDMSGRWVPNAYYFDADAVREEGEGYGRSVRKGGDLFDAVGFDARHKTGTGAHTFEGGRNLRSVWTIATEPYPGAHFATFPRKLVEPCVKAGTSERGVCPECGAPWVRVVERVGVREQSPLLVGKQARSVVPTTGGGTRANSSLSVSHSNPSTPIVNTTGWRPTCRCLDADGGQPPEPAPAVVLDPFAGSGTTLLVAQSLGRRGIGIDLNPEYLRQALARNAQTPLGLVG